MQLVLPHLLCAALFATVVCVLARRAVQEYREFHRYPVGVHLGSVRRRAVSRHERIGSPTFAITALRLASDDISALSAWPERNQLSKVGMEHASLHDAEGASSRAGTVR